MYRFNHKNKKVVLKIAFFINLLLILITTSCGKGDSTGPGGIETWTPTPSATPTCQPNISLSTPAGWGESTRLFVVLFDPRINGDQYLDLADGTKTQDIPLFINKVVPEIMKHGDEAAVFYMGYSSYDDARIARLYSYLTPPPLYNTPAPPATLPPLQPTAIPTFGFGEVATKNAIRSQSTEMAGTEIAQNAIYNCEVDYWNNNVQLTATSWIGTATAEIGGLSNDLDTGLKNLKNNEITKGKPFSTDELYYGGVYYGLSFATTVFQSDCKKYGTCVLLIIDDMNVYEPKKPDNLTIDLSGVKTYVIMPNCKDKDDQTCKTLEDYWDNEFPKFGATPPSYSTGDRAETNLLNAFGSK